MRVVLAAVKPPPPHPPVGPTHQPPPPKPLAPPPPPRTISLSLAQLTFLRPPAARPRPSAALAPSLRGELPSPSPLVQRGPCPAPVARLPRPAWCPGARGAAPYRLPPPAAWLPLSMACPTSPSPAMAQPQRGALSPVRSGLGAARPWHPSVRRARPRSPRPHSPCPRPWRGACPRPGARPRPRLWHARLVRPSALAQRGTARPLPLPLPRPGALPCPGVLTSPRPDSPAPPCVSAAARPRCSPVPVRSRCGASTAWRGRPSGQPRCLLAARARLDPDVRADCSRCVSVALRARARVVLWHGSPCPRHDA
jgi:hypothetical protein